MKTVKAILLSILMLFTTSCGPLLAYGIYELTRDDDGEEDYSPTTPAIEARATYAIALGGVAPGRDELILTNDTGSLLDLSGNDLRFETDSDAVGFLPRPDYDDFASGSGTRIVPQKVGFAVVTYYIDDVAQEDQFLVIVPPQSFIQMLVAEASGQLTAEADVGEDHHVKLDSTSATGNALGSVTRNRINLILATEDYSLFNVDEYEWRLNPPESHYDSVIGAVGDGVYQYSPVDPDDLTHGVYTDAEARGFLEETYHRAYDQAVLTSAYIFVNETGDTTGGAFAFFSPTEDEWQKIESAYNSNLLELPLDCGVSDEDFPYYAPIQILILPETWTSADGKPAFVFIRARDSTDYAVVKTP